MSRRLAADGTWTVEFPGFRSELDAERFETKVVELVQWLKTAAENALEEDLLVVQRHPDAVGCLADLLRLGQKRAIKGQLHVDLSPGNPDRVRLFTEQERRAVLPPPSPVAGRRGDRRKRSA